MTAPVPDLVADLSLGRDLRFALRALRRHRGFTLASLATLALGIGATTAIFAVIHAALLRPLPYREPERLVQLQETQGEGGGALSEASYPDFLDWQSQSSPFAGFEGYEEGNMTVTQPDGAFLLRGVRVTSGFFTLLGVTPALDAPGATPVVVLTGRYWRRAFGADPGVVAGCLLALGLGRFLRALLFEVKATDPATYFAVVLLLGAFAPLATAVPALRAARANPATVLHPE